MSRGKLRGGPDASCADCGMPDPAWVSVSRGVLICDECCVVHRSLGRHISQIKSLRKGLWSPTQLAMVHALNNNGANAIWEHSLLDPTNAKSGRKKPNPKDPIHPTKADFVRAKHQMLAFVYRPGRDELQFTEGDVSKQLHSSVRTGNLETSLRLLSLGADPNFFHEEKGTRAMHVAAKAGQVSQVELLAVYGADPGAFDSHGKTPVDYARLHHNDDLADRLVELQFELTDRLAHYLCGRKPDHQSGSHFIIPEMADRLDVSEFAKSAKKKLQSLPNTLFEELGMDIYDEVDRRETDAIWLSMHFEADRTVPFLPVNPELSSIRNQGRQKLARFNAREFATLIIDFLTEAKRRQMGLPLTNNAKDRTSSPGCTETFAKMKIARRKRNPDANSDDEPLYDSVASDEESHTSHVHHPRVSGMGMGPGTLAETGSREKTPDVIAQIGLSEKLEAKTSDKAKFQMPKESKQLSTCTSGGTKSPVSMELYMDVRKQLLSSQAQIRQLMQNNSTMKQEIGVLQGMLHKLMDENASLRSRMQNEALPNGHESVATLPHVQRSPRLSKCLSTRPQSMYEPRNYQQTWPPNPYGGVSNRDSATHFVPDRSKAGYVGNFPSHERCCSRHEIVGGSHHRHQILPTQEEVVKKTEQITKRIQELLISAQESKHESFIPCSEKIHAAVLEMATLFPEESRGGNVATMLHQLTTSALRLQMECQSLMVPSVCQSMDICFITQQVIQCAYDVAKAAKQLVTNFQ